MKTKTNPLISIVLPTHNGEKYIGQAIQSCLSQTYKNIELIVIDDASGDDTKKIIKKFRDQRIKYLYFEKNLRLPKALNEGFKRAKGDFFTWISDDNFFHRNALKEMINFLKENDENFVYSDYWTLNESKKQFSKRAINDFYRGNFIGPSFLYTKKLADNVGLYDHDKELIEDYDYWFRASKKFKLTFLPKKLYYYRSHKKSLSYKKNKTIQILFELFKLKNNLGNPRTIYQRILYLTEKNNHFFIKTLLIFFKLNIIGFRKVSIHLTRK